MRSATNHGRCDSAPRISGKSSARNPCSICCSLPALTAAGVWWAYPLLWLLPLLTWQMVITRIRNIAEHAVVPDSSDPLRNTRTTRAGFLERLFIAPYYVNYHLEHHLLFYVPCYNLPRVHKILSRSEHAGRMEVQPNYLAVLRLATAKPANEDRPGALVSNVRRSRAGASRGQQSDRVGILGRACCGRGSLHRHCEER